MMDEELDYDEIDQADEKIVDEAIRLLMTRFDSVQVFANRYDGRERGTINWTKGEGNHAARTGMIREWIIREDEAERRKVRRHGK